MTTGTVAGASVISYGLNRNFSRDIGNFIGGTLQSQAVSAAPASTVLLFEATGTNANITGLPDGSSIVGEGGVAESTWGDISNGFGGALYTTGYLGNPTHPNQYGEYKEILTELVAEDILDNL